MKFTILTITAALIGFGSAQLSGLPTCAQGCADDSIPSSCGTSVSCICGSASFISGVTCCVAANCSIADQETTIKFAQSLCEGAGVSDIPTTASCASTASSTATSGSSSSTSSLAASITSAVSNASSSATSSAASALSSSSATTTASSATSSSTSSSGSDANNVVVAHGIGAIGVAVVGAFALL